MYVLSKTKSVFPGLSFASLAKVDYYSFCAASLKKISVRGNILGANVLKGRSLQIEHFMPITSGFRSFREITIKLKITVNPRRKSVD